VENEDLVTVTVTFASGAIGTLSASRVAQGMPNALGFELFTESGAAISTWRGPVSSGSATPSRPPRPPGTGRSLVGRRTPTSRAAWRWTSGVNYGRTTCSSTRTAPSSSRSPVSTASPCPSFEHGLRNMRLMAAVVASAASGGAEIVVD
jgi:predicted dehydrogenase